MAFKSNDFLWFFIEIDNFNHAHIFIRDRKYALILSCRQRNQPTFILYSHEWVRAVEILEIVYINLRLEDNHNSILPQLYIKDIWFEVEFTKRPMLDVVPQNQPVEWIVTIFTSPYKTYDIGPEKHLC